MLSFDRKIKIVPLAGRQERVCEVGTPPVFVRDTGSSCFILDEVHLRELFFLFIISLIMVHFVFRLLFWSLSFFL